MWCLAWALWPRPSGGARAGTTLFGYVCPLIQKTAVSFSAALLVGIAEVVLYARYWRAIEAQRRRRARLARPLTRSMAQAACPHDPHRPHGVPPG